MLNFRTKNFRSYRVKYYFNHQFHERFMSVNWISYERDIENIIHAEFGHAAHVIDVMPYLD